MSSGRCYKLISVMSISGASVRFFYCLQWCSRWVSSSSSTILYQTGQIIRSVCFEQYSHWCRLIQSVSVGSRGCHLSHQRDPSLDQEDGLMSYQTWSRHGQFTAICDGNSAKNIDSDINSLRFCRNWDVSGCRFVASRGLSSLRYNFLADSSTSSLILPCRNVLFLRD